jgi:DNA-binding GntR family transcriptional regulator
MNDQTIIKPRDEGHLREGLLEQVQRHPGEPIATIIRPFRFYLGEQTLRSRLFRLEKEGLITIERRFRRAYVFPANNTPSE